MKNLFNTYFWNLDGNMTRLQYWTLWMIIIAVALIVNITEDIFNIDATLPYYLDIVREIVFLYIGGVMILKRCNDIGCNIWISTAFAIGLNATPMEFDEIGLVIAMVIGLIPNINTVKDNLAVYRKLFN